MLVALFCILVLAGGNTSAAESFVKQLDKLVGKELKDPAARTEAKAAVGEMKESLGEYNAKLKQAATDIAQMNAGYTVSATEFENTVRELDGARSNAFGHLVAARARLRAAIPPGQWDSILGAAARAKR
jgi:hypothetical protein